MRTCRTWFPQQEHLCSKLAQAESKETSVGAENKHENKSSKKIKSVDMGRCASRRAFADRPKTSTDWKTNATCFS